MDFVWFCFHWKGVWLLSESREGCISFVGFVSSKDDRKIRRPNKFTESQAKLWKSWIIYHLFVSGVFFVYIFCRSESESCMLAELIVETRILIFHV